MHIYILMHKQMLSNHSVKEILLQTYYYTLYLIQGNSVLIILPLIKVKFRR